MREDVTYIDHLPAVFDDHNEPVLVPSNVEHREHAHGIRLRTSLSQIAPRGPFRHMVPVKQRLQSIGVFLRELGNGPLTNNPQRNLLGYQNGNRDSPVPHLRRCAA